MAIIPPFFLDAVVSIGIRKEHNDIVWIGTGFFVIRLIEGNRGKPFLISNRHVFQGNTGIVIRMKERNTSNLKICDAQLVSNDGKPLYAVHPNSKIDVAILPLSPDYINNNNLEFPAFDIDSHAMTSSQLRSAGVDEGSLIYMLGFPMGLVNNNSGLPICRLGCIARISETQILEDHNILVDLQNFPGNSGSPIILRPEFVSVGGSPALGKSVLVGIVHSYIPYKESLINSQTKEVVEIRSENSGIANAHPVEYILEILDSIFPKPTKDIPEKKQ